MSEMFEHMMVFAKVVETGSITKAAEQLKITKSSVSKRLSDLESALGVKLMQRTTRRSHLTEAGELYLRKSQMILEEVESLHTGIQNLNQGVVGELRIAAPLTFGLLHLTPLLDAFSVKHPDIKLNVDLSDRQVDILDEGYDLAIRIGHLADSSLRAKALCDIHHVICSSPSYLAKHGVPSSPEALKHHRFLRYEKLPLSGIKMKDPAGQTITASIQSHMISNSGDYLKAMAVGGHGIIFSPKFIVQDALNDGNLIPLLTDYSLISMKAYALYPNTRYVPHRVRLMIDHLAEALSRLVISTEHQHG